MTRRRLIGWVLAGAVLYRWFSDDAEPATTTTLQAAVLADGFALLEGSSSARHVVGFDHDGQRRFRHAVPLSAPDVKVAGSVAGPVVSWRDKTKIALAQLRGDGELGKPSQWGKSVRLVCDGVASNEHRFAFAWTDKDQQVWFVHGPASARRTPEVSALAELEPAAAPSWCGIASAHQDVTLLWREGSRSFFTFCSTKECSMFARLPLDKQHTLRGFGCTKDACVLAARAGGDLRLGWVTRSGKVLWSRGLPDATPDTTFSIVGAGDRAIAVGYLTETGATIQRVIASGSMERVWQGPSATAAPAIAWARDRLFVAHRDGDAVVTDVVPLPR